VGQQCEPARNRILRRNLALADGLLIDGHEPLPGRLVGVGSGLFLSLLRVQGAEEVVSPQEKLQTLALKCGALPEVYGCGPAHILFRVCDDFATVCCLSAVLGGRGGEYESASFWVPLTNLCVYWRASLELFGSKTYTVVLQRL